MPLTVHQIAKSDYTAGRLRMILKYFVSEILLTMVALLKQRRRGSKLPETLIHITCTSTHMNLKVSPSCGEDVYRQIKW